MGGTVIIGAGAIGLTMASAIGAAGLPVVIVARDPEKRRALAAEGLRRQGVLTSALVPPEQLSVVALADALALEPDCLLVAVRAPDLARLAAELQQARVPATTSIVVAVNGFDVTSELEAALPQSPILRAVVTTGARLNAPNLVEVSVHGAPVAIGPTGPIAEALAQTLTRGGLSAETRAEIADLAKAKALLNCCVNAPAAVARCTIGELVATAAGRALLEGVLDEAWQVTVGKIGLLDWASADAYLRHLMTRVVPKIGSHEPSMLRDLRDGRTTEIAPLNGFVVRAAEQQGLHAPLNRFIVEAVLSCATLTFKNSLAA